MIIRFGLLSLLLALPLSLFGTTHLIVSSGFSFSPNSITVNSGDTVHFALAGIHNAVEVSLTTWNANDTTSNGGFRLPFGGGTTVMTAAGTHYYVCQAHASMGMKGMIIVNTPPPPNSITVRSIVDQDGNLSSGNDEVLKKWSLKLYKDSVGSGIVLDAVSSAESLRVGGLSAGTYAAVEADSQFWSHISVLVDGISQGGVTANHWSITVTSGEDHVIDFVNFSSNTIISSGQTFVPDSMMVFPGDRVQFVLETGHNAREVSQAAWLANDTTPNGGFQVPLGDGSIVLIETGTHYYISTPDANAGMKGRIVVVPESVSVAVASNIIAGWNLLSLPVRAPDNSVSTLFPAAVSRAFAYQGSYTPLTTMTEGYGYWLKFNNPQTDTLKGLSLKRDSLAAQQGWNMIGSLSVPLAAGNLTSQPPGIISSVLYGFNGTYFTADTIVPGFGYWLKTSQSGELYLSSLTDAANFSGNEEKILHGTGKLVIRDSDGNKKALYLVDGGAETPGMRRMEELPPVPPAGAFDVRFTSGHQLKKIGAVRGENYPVQISSAVYPITLEWNMKSLQQPVSLHLDGGEIVLSGTGSVTIVQPVRSMSVRIVSASPNQREYSLSQAFPNPFNPGTLIQYFLPVRSRVELKIFNILGQETGTLVNAVQDAGQRSVTWDAGDVTSGMYFVQLRAVSASDGSQSYHRVIKVVLQK